VRRTAPRPLAFALSELEEQLRPATALAEIQAAWPRAAGAAIAREAGPVAERDGVVELACRSSVWAQELDLMALELTDRLNSELGRDAVRSLRCVAVRRGGGRNA
jgi:predicted nucleic acid-binding Zn ribbon protein